MIQFITFLFMMAATSAHASEADNSPMANIVAEMVFGPDRDDNDDSDGDD